MAGDWAAQSRVDDLDDIEDWMAQRNASVGLRQQADVLARTLWNQATQDGTNLAAPQSSDLTSIGLAALGSGIVPDTGSSNAGSSNSDAVAEAGAAPQAFDSDTSTPATQRGAEAPSYRIVTAQPGDSISRLVGTSRPGAIGRFASLNGLTGSTLRAGSAYYLPTSYDDAKPGDIAAGNQILRSDNSRLAATQAAASDGRANLFADRLSSGRNVWTGEFPEHVAPPVAETTPVTAPWWDRWAPAKGIAGTMATAAGLPVGFSRGAIHLGQDIGGGMDFGARLLDPHDAENHLPGEAAWDQAADTGQGVLSYGRQRLADPGRLLGDLANLGHEARVNLDPLPIAPTLDGQLRRNFSVGENWGEGGFDLGALIDGGEILKGAKGAEILSDAAEAPEYLRSGAPPELADYLAEPYDGIGAHFVPRRAKFKKTMMGIPVQESLVGKPLLPKWYMDSPFNIWKPDGISRGDFNVGHFRRDDRMYGTKLPKTVDGGQGWSGNRLGLQRYSPVGRIWNSAPLPFKAAVGGASAVAGLATYDTLNPGVPQ